MTICTSCENPLGLLRRCSDAACLEAVKVREALTLKRWEVLVRNHESIERYSVLVVVRAQTMEGARCRALRDHSLATSAAVRDLTAHRVRSLEGHKLTDPWIACPHDIDWNAR